MKQRALLHRYSTKNFSAAIFSTPFLRYAQSGTRTAPRRRVRRCTRFFDMASLPEALSGDGSVGREPLRPAAETLYEVLRIATGIFRYLTYRDGNKLRLASRSCRGLVAAAPWFDEKSCVLDIKLFRDCYPLAKAMNLSVVPSPRRAVAAEDIPLFEGLHTLLGGGYHSVVSVVFTKCLSSSIRSLYLRDCQRITDAGLENLSLIHTLDISQCSNISDAGLKYLANIHSLKIEFTKITDNGLAHLTKVHTLDASYCAGITDAGLRNLPGTLHNLRIQFNQNITDAGLTQIRGVRILDISYCNQITPACVNSLMRNGCEVKT